MKNENETQQFSDSINTSFMRLFEKMPFRVRIARIISGLRQDRDSGAYRWARLQLMHLWSWLSAVLVPLAAVLLLLLFSQRETVTERLIDAVPIMPEPVPDIEVFEPIPPDMKLTPIENNKDLVVPDIPFQPTAINDSVAEDSQPDVSQVADRQPVEGVCKTISRISMPVPHGPRSGPGRDEILKRYPESGVATECAVLNALRWLKAEQKPDGSWDGYSKAGVTALAALAFLAHGETPSSQSGFELTVEKAIKWLCANQEEDGRFKGRDPHDYAHPICTYALCEAYTMTKIPSLKCSAEKALKIIIEGQHPDGGWDYNCRQSDRNDTSYMGWCVQAVKAAYVAGIGDPDAVKKSMKSATVAFKRNANTAGWFGYVNNQPNHTGLSSAGVLSLQLLGSPSSGETKRGLKWCEKNISFDWDKPAQQRPVYIWYYLTQAYFQEGGKVWETWNSQFAKALAGRQNVIKGASADGKDIGWWETPGQSEKSYGRVYDTTLCTLMLEVYYRNLPSSAITAAAGSPKPAAGINQIVDITIR